MTVGAVLRVALVALRARVLPAALARRDDLCDRPGLLGLAAVPDRLGLPGLLGLLVPLHGALMVVPAGRGLLDGLDLRCLLVTLVLLALAVTAGLLSLLVTRVLLALVVTAGLRSLRGVLVRPHLGANAVAVVSSEDKIELCKRLGAAAVIQKPLSREMFSASLTELGLFARDADRPINILLVAADPVAAEAITERVGELATTILAKDLATA